jgi:hypothetical protein
MAGDGEDGVITSQTWGFVVNTIGDIISNTRFNRQNGILGWIKAYETY